MALDTIQRIAHLTQYNRVQQSYINISKAFKMNKFALLRVLNYEI